MQEERSLISFTRFRFHFPLDDFDLHMVSHERIFHVNRRISVQEKQCAYIHTYIFSLYIHKTIH